MPTESFVTPIRESKWGYIRLIGYSPTADAVLTVIIRPGDRAGVTAWKTSGADLLAYRKERETRHDRP